MRLDATLEALKQQCEAEAAQAEACVYEIAASDLEEEGAQTPQRIDSTERTQDYIKHQLILKKGTGPFGNIEPNDTLATTHSPWAQSIDTLEEYVPLPLSADNRDNVPQSSQSVPVQKSSPGASSPY